jgi:hypothetical protein
MIVARGEIVMVDYPFAELRLSSLWHWVIRRVRELVCGWIQSSNARIW